MSYAKAAGLIVQPRMPGVDFLSFLYGTSGLLLVSRALLADRRYSPFQGDWVVDELPSNFFGGHCLDLQDGGLSL